MVHIGRGRAARAARVRPQEPPPQPTPLSIVDRCVLHAPPRLPLVCVRTDTRNSARIVRGGRYGHPSVLPPPNPAWPVLTKPRSTAALSSPTPRPPRSPPPTCSSCGRGRQRTEGGPPFSRPWSPGNVYRLRELLGAAIFWFAHWRASSPPPLAREIHTAAMPQNGEAEEQVA